MKSIPFEDVFSIKKHLAGDEAHLGALVRGMFPADFNIMQRQAPLRTVMAPANLNETCFCVDSRRRWPLSRRKHLPEICWNRYNPGAENHYTGMRSP